MKISALAAVLALSCATAFAAQNTTTQHDATVHKQSSVAAANDNTASPSAGEKSKNVLRRLADKTRNAMHRLASKGKKSDADTQQARNGDTRSMGAAGTDTTTDSARRRRMDDAYANYKSKQKQ